MHFFAILEKLLEERSIVKKLQSFKRFYQEFRETQDIDFINNKEIKVFENPSFYKLCTIVHPTKVPNRKNLHTKEGMGILLHAIAHIEYSAIDLALDACYRFRGLPREYYEDWMEVADDEVRHFEMICKLMGEYDIEYGDIPVHQGLFDASMKSLEFIPRMALIPRYMEANGLDANQMLIDKLQYIPNTQKVIDLLTIILDEEIDHVKKGDYWYKYGCNQKENFSCDYFKIVNTIYPNSFKGNKHINHKARKEAGFSDKELETLQSFAKK
jgi:uncharacterized ferritin-like protein (DUF455 family)